MTSFGCLQILCFCLALIIASKPLGSYMYRVFEGASGLEFRILGPLEKLCYKLFGVDAEEEMSWREYALALLAFSLVGGLFTYFVLRLQGFLPLNPMHFSTSNAPSFASSMSPDLAFNTAVSFLTNTNWQNYSGESTLSYLSQMLGLSYHNWISAAVGMVACVALSRGFCRHSASTIGNFWKDLTRSLLYIFLPILFVYSLFLVSQGVIQNFEPYTVVKTVEGASQVLPQGPVATQEAVKMLGVNGGGFFNANSAHPFENPTPISNFVQMLSIFLLPSAMTFMFGKMVKDTRQGWALFAVMFALFLAGTLFCYNAESYPSSQFEKNKIETSTAVLGDLGGNMEGKELRFGLANSALFACVTTDASCGAVNCMHDSLTPIGGLVTLLNIQLGEIVFGGVGSGLYGMLVFAVITVFIAGLMVGRTPEYLGKKIEQKDVKMCMLFVLIACFSILFFSAVAAVTVLPQNSVLNAFGPLYRNTGNAGPHGLSELIYCFSSATGNNGSAFAGLSANTPFYNVAIAIAMLLGRFLMMVPVLALAGTLASKKYTPPTPGTFPTHGPLFVVLLISIILIVGALTFFPALTLGPIAEHFLMQSNRLF